MKDIIIKILSKHMALIWTLILLELFTIASIIVLIPIFIIFTLNL